MILVCSLRRATGYTRNCYAFASRSSRSLFGWNSSQAGEHVQRYTLTKIMNAPPEQVYNVVSEISKYRDFIPYCEDSFVNKRNPIDGKPTEAGLRIGFRQYDEKYTCKIKCTKLIDDGVETYRVIADSITESLFRGLCTRWTIKPHPERPHASKVELILSFEMRSRLYNSVSALFASSVTELAMKAFDKRVFQLRRQALKASTLNKTS
ncbi:hypothetical protein HG536_0H04430 [Torulaspora globosa]|uniref:Coenzyme Q-binding protein COQ10 START domain-containing protein n=1 Tax=Torulaspora globosa TaxID=48254 RepID=A0A7G3ZNI1_9SACH|nr:uncharacterized protein HG536_0H04430 [Torulaspora globosa]QLL35067.1 hypothetical protein HG536_0H04430 [Torulaspora globosa]